MRCSLCQQVINSSPLKVMIELLDSDAELISGGGPKSVIKLGSGNKFRLGVVNSLTTTNNIAISPQLNLAVNIATFGSSINNGQFNFFSVA